MSDDTRDLIDVGYTHPLRQFAVHADAWGHQRTGLMRPIEYRREWLERQVQGGLNGATPEQIEALDPMELRDAAWEDDEGRLPLDPGYTGTFWTGRTRPVDPELIARQDLSVAYWHTLRYVAATAVLAMTVRDEIDRLLAEQHDALDLEQTRRFQQWVRDRNRRRETERARKAIAVQRAASEAKREARRAADAKRDEGTREQWARSRAPIPEAAIQRAYVLYYEHDEAFLAIGATLIDEGLVDPSTTPKRLRDRLRTEWGKRGWATRSPKEARATTIKRERESGQPPAVRSSLKLTPEQITAALDAYVALPADTPKRAKMRTVAEIGWNTNEHDAQGTYASLFLFYKALRRKWDKHGWWDTAAARDALAATEELELARAA